MNIIMILIQAVLLVSFGAIGGAAVGVGLSSATGQDADLASAWYVVGGAAAGLVVMGILAPRVGVPRLVYVAAAIGTAAVLAFFLRGGSGSVPA